MNYPGTNSYMKIVVAKLSFSKTFMKASNKSITLQMRVIELSLINLHISKNILELINLTKRKYS